MNSYNAKKADNSADPDQTAFEKSGQGLTHVAQSVTYLTADMCLTADPGVVSLILALSHTFAKIDNEIIHTAILLPSSDTRRVDVSYK